MERFFILDKFNTWYDWRLIVTKKTIAPPDPKTNYVDLGNVNGTIDLSESLTGEIAYKDRTVSASFWTDNGSFAERIVLLSDITAALHGKKIKIVEPDDPTHYFVGRAKIKTPVNILPYATFTLEATCEPWRYAIDETVRTVTVDSVTPTHLVFNNRGVKTLSPVITVTGAVTIVYDGVEQPLTDGTYRITDLKFRQGNNVVGLYGNGTAVFTYREATL